MTRSKSEPTGAGKKGEKKKDKKQKTSFTPKPAPELPSAEAYFQVLEGIRTNAGPLPPPAAAPAATAPAATAVEKRGEAAEEAAATTATTTTTTQVPTTTATSTTAPPPIEATTPTVQRPAPTSAATPTTQAATTTQATAATTPAAATAAAQATTTSRPASPTPKMLSSFPHNIEFRCENFLTSEIEEKRGTTFDVVLCLRLTKWVHVNWGDEGIKNLFHKCFSLLKPGGLLVLESQDWRSYLKNDRLSRRCRETRDAIELMPDEFGVYLVHVIGFCPAISIGTSPPLKRPMLLFRRPAAGEADPRGTGPAPVLATAAARKMREALAASAPPPEAEDDASDGPRAADILAAADPAVAAGLAAFGRRSQAAPAATEESATAANTGAATAAATAAVEAATAAAAAATSAAATATTAAASAAAESAASDAASTVAGDEEEPSAKRAKTTA